MNGFRLLKRQNYENKNSRMWIVSEKDIVVVPSDELTPTFITNRVILNFINGEYSIQFEKPNQPVEIEIKQDSDQIDDRGEKADLDLVMDKIRKSVIKMENETPSERPVWFDASDASNLIIDQHPTSTDMFLRDVLAFVRDLRYERFSDRARSVTEATRHTETLVFKDEYGKILALVMDSANNGKYTAYIPKQIDLSRTLIQMLQNDGFNIDVRERLVCW